MLYPTLGALLARVVTTRRERLYIMACAIFLAVIIGLSRIYLGVHDPTDVLTGGVDRRLRLGGAVVGIRPLVAAPAGTVGYRAPGPCRGRSLIASASGYSVAITTLDSSSCW